MKIDMSRTNDILESKFENDLVNVSKIKSECYYVFAMMHHGRPTQLTEARVESITAKKVLLTINPQWPKKELIEFRVTKAGLKRKGSGLLYWPLDTFWQKEFRKKVKTA